MNGDGVVGAAILIKNEPGSKNEFRVLGNVQIGENYIEIVPVVTYEQANKRRRSSDGGEMTGYDASENSHAITQGPLPPRGFDNINMENVTPSG